MTRASAECYNSVAVESVSSANLYRLVIVIVLALVCSGAYFAIRRTQETLGDPSDKFVIKIIPNEFSSKLERLDPEDREVFEGFKTSFIPAVEVLAACKGKTLKREAYDVNHMDVVLHTQPHFESPNRMKRENSEDYREMNLDYLSEKDEDKEIEREKEVEEYQTNEPSDRYGDIHSLESIVPPGTHVDRGPLDDVVEHVRGQPELEEGEMLSSAHIFKPTKAYTAIHAFWKGQGDRNTIRNSQANIMKQYMDEEADPCTDFYQYACGNWAALNPIPADKAGYDTFEMLRENLDAVLKDLLEFKKTEHVVNTFPGTRLDVGSTVFLSIAPAEQFNTDISLTNTTREDKLPAANLASAMTPNKKELLSRIRRFLNQKSNQIVKPLAGVKNKFISSLSMTDKHAIKNMQTLNENLKRSKYTKRDTRFLKQVFANYARDMNEDPADGDAALKARFLFKSCMNYEILEKRGHQPLLDLLNLLGGWPILDPHWYSPQFDWLELMAKLRLFNNDILISEWVGPDIKNSDEFVIQFDQTSLGLPTREYFLQKSNAAYLNAYKNYLVKIALLLGGEEQHVKKSADELIQFEIRLAKITSAPEDRRNVSDLYRKMPLRKLEIMVPEVKWKRYLSIVMNRTVSDNETVVIFALNYVRHLVKLVHETESSILSNYLLWRFVRHRVNNLDDRFQSAKQEFYYTLFGREQAPPRWKNCISQVNSNMGMALGSMFVKKYFDENSKNDTLTMTREIQKSFRELLHMIDWIDDETKQLAAHKVDAMMLRIGYPDFILNKKELDERYKEVTIHPDKYFENILNILQHLTKMEQLRIGQPVNKTLWNTAPAVVNAYYSRNKNQIMFPAGILQPPFYHRHFPRSLNYGGIGVVIGHEITHGFDDKGRLFDCDGNLHRWWSDPAIDAFHRRAQCLIDQYSRYVVPEVNMKLDGVNTQGENIADNGGVKQAFRAYLRWLRAHGTEGETLPGLNHTHTQLFFLNFAQVWCGVMRPEAMRNKLKTAVHSPGRFRVVGTLANSRDFAREFHCAPGSPMNPKQKCTVW